MINMGFLIQYLPCWRKTLKSLYFYHQGCFSAITFDEESSGSQKHFCSCWSPESEKAKPFWVKRDILILWQMCVKPNNLVNFRKNQTILVNVCKNGQQDKHCLQRNDKTHGLPRLSGQSLDCTDSFKIIHTVSFVRRIAEANENLHFYRTQVSLGSDLWVRFSLTNSLRNLVADLTYLMKILTQY